MSRTTNGCLYKRGKFYWLKFQTAGTVHRQPLKVTTRAEAELLRREIVRPLQAGDKIAQVKALAAQVAGLDSELQDLSAARDRIPLAEAWERFPYDRTSPRRGTIRRLSKLGTYNNRVTWEAFLAWLAGSHKECRFMEDVTPGLAAEYSAALHRRQLSPGRINKIVACCGMMFALASRTNPFAGIKPHQVRYESRNNLEMEQLQAVCSTATGELRRLFAILLFTGLRLGDAVTLKWESIHDGRIFMTVRKTGKELAFPLLPLLEGVLSEIPAPDRHGHVCPGFAAKYEKNPTLIPKYIKDHLEACGISCTEKVPGRARGISRYGAHSFRHSFITACARAGVPAGLIRDWVGHESQEITRIYEHWRIADGSGQIAAALSPAGAVFALPAITVEASEVDEIGELREKLARAAATATADKIRKALQALE